MSDMPSTENPTHYERARGMSPGRHDWFFKAYPIDFYIADTGRTEAPTGHVALVKITTEDKQHLAREMNIEVDTTPILENTWPDEGWYIIRSDDNGLVWGIWYGGWCRKHKAFCADTYEEERARADFAEAEAVYAEWDTEL